jgi:glycosyltransferase involved in cell wall biosynthesis
MSSPRCSAILLVYNHAHTVEEALRSLLVQSMPPDEIIVSDDCSTDGSWKVLQRVAQEDPRVRPLRTPRNLGMAGNANFAVAQAQGKYVALLHHDDICDPRLIQEWARVLDAHPSVAFVFNGYALQDGSIHRHEFAECTPGRWLLERRLLKQWGCPIRGTAMIRKACWDAVGGMDEQFGLLADVDLWMRLATRWDAGYVPLPLIEVGVARPQGYPEEYTRFSWRRQQLVFQIHAANVPRVFGQSRPRLALEWTRLRWRVSVECVKWLLYGVVKGRVDVLGTADEGQTPYEWPVVRGVRWVAQRLRKVPGKPVPI